MIACHPSQEKAQTILSIIDFLGIDFALTVVNDAPKTLYQNLLFNIGWLLAIVDICALIDNLFHDNQYDKSLLSYWKSDMAGYELISNIDKSRNADLEMQIRAIRNTFGAHLDSTLSLPDIFSQFESIDLSATHQYACYLVNSFFTACRQDIRTKGFCILNVPLTDVIAVQRNAYKAFNS
jgi:hypothetical protein